MKIKHFLLLSLFLIITASANAETLFHNDARESTIIELFTSQGCSSCPPAERWLGDFKDDPRLWKSLFPLAFHVDYWDYIGWKDIYAKPEFTQRQRQYKTARAIASIYTPGFVVNGKEWRGWFSRKPLPNTSTSGDLSARLENNQLTAKYIPDAQSSHQLTLNVAVIATGIKTKIKTGENSGRTLSQDFTVLHYQSENSPVGSWKMKVPQINTTSGARLALVIWVSQLSSKQPLQIAGNWLK